MTHSAAQTITIRKNSTGWQATFAGSRNMPNGVALPLPFGFQAPAQMVRDDLRSRFPGCGIVTKADSR